MKKQNRQIANQTLCFTLAKVTIHLLYFLRCRFCLDKPKFGGPGRLKQKCIERRCVLERQSGGGTDCSKSTSNQLQSGLDATKQNMDNLKPIPVEAESDDDVEIDVDDDV